MERSRNMNRGGRLRSRDGRLSECIDISKSKEMTLIRAYHAGRIKTVLIRVFNINIRSALVSS